MNGIRTYEALVENLKHRGVKPPRKEQVRDLFVSVKVPERVIVEPEPKPKKKTSKAPKKATKKASEGDSKRSKAGAARDESTS